VNKNNLEANEAEAKNFCKNNPKIIFLQKQKISCTCTLI